MSADQPELAAALLDPSRPRPEGLTDAHGAEAGRRFDVYRNNIAVSLIDALETGFPVTTRLLGSANMRGFAGVFLRQTPPSSPVMFRYGAGFPEFLETAPDLDRWPYLADSVRLELDLRESYHAADSEPLAPSMLGSLAPDTLLTTRLDLAPSLRLRRSRWPIFDIWRYNTEEGADPPRSVAQDVVTLRIDYDPAPHPLSPGAAAWIGAILNGATIGEAHDIALAEAPAFDLGPTLSLLLEAGAITQLHPEDLACGH